MTFLSSLSSDDIRSCSSLITEALSARRHVDLMVWLQGGDVQRFLPHDIMIASWGNCKSGLIHHDIISMLPGIRTGYMDDATLTPLLQKLFRRWVKLGKVPFEQVADDSSVLVDPLSCQGGLSDTLQAMRSLVVHGISDERGRHDCLYVAFSSQPGLDGAARDAMAFLLPYIDIALRQVSHLPSQHALAAPPPPAQPMASQESDLSDREAEIMRWVRMGKTNCEIASILGISTFTVKNHLQRIFKKLDAFNRMQAVSRLSRGTPDA